MKKIVLTSLLTLLTALVFAQNYIPAVKVGSVLTYEAFVRNLGQRIPITLTVKTMGDPMNTEWNVAGMGTGVFSVSGKAQESGTKLAIKEPSADNVTKLKDDETFLTVSKSTFASLVKSEPFELNGIKFAVVAGDTTVYTINNKVVSVIYARSENKKSHLWVLNNPELPLVCAETAIARGIDMTLLSIKE